jgi:hypothetical protein
LYFTPLNEKRAIFPDREKKGWRIAIGLIYSCGGNGEHSRKEAEQIMGI